MNPHTELTEVELPLIDQLVAMGWKHTQGELDEPGVTFRSSFREVLLRPDLGAALHRINLRDGAPWLDAGRIAEAVSALERIAAPRLMEANQLGTELLQQGLSVEGLPDWDGGRSQTIHYIDWEHPENNTFRVINQFRVDEPGGQAKRFIVPDAVLFINGIPVVVIECKSPASSEPMEEAIEQLRRYSNQRHEYADNEGNERLFHTNQLLVATSFDEARAATIGARAEHFMEWKDTTPFDEAELAAELEVRRLASQQRLVAGMLRPENLLDLIRHFTLYKQVSGRTVKIVARYQQYRAVQRAIVRLRTGKTRLEDGEYDRRGGIIWHTQGSGKSLTMVFLIRKMRSIPELRRFKVIAVTDRKDLQRQLSGTAVLSGESVLVAATSEELKSLLSAEGPGLVLATIQKYQERNDTADEEPYTFGDVIQRAAESGLVEPLRRDEPEFPVLNEDTAILVMVDEAHRSHANALHGNLLKALPNCARIGFTGTPIIMGAKKRTHEIFGDFIDRYTIQQSEEDGATVPILYEGRTAEGAVREGQSLDDLFEDLFVDRSEEELEAIKSKYATRGNVLEAPALIADKARDMLRHYVDTILPNGWKAQVVASSRRAALRYHEALSIAREELVCELEALPPQYLSLDANGVELLPRYEQFLVRAHPLLATIRQLEFAPVISGATNDPPDWSEWSDGSKVANRIDRFLKPLGNVDPATQSPLAFLIVKSMLLTGFDAPIEAVMYLDRPIREAELLQAIARVNRTGHKKKAGFVVDYYGVARHLKEALEAYSAEDVEGALRSLKDEIPKLRDRHDRVVQLFTDRGVADINDTLACVDLLEDERLFAEFSVKLRQFLSTLDLVLPRPEALPYVHDAKTLAFIYARARNRYRPPYPPIGRDVGAKVRKLIDDHVLSLGVDPRIPPISIVDAKFADHIGRQPNARAKASEMEHAIRHHIRRHLDEDPVYFAKLSERLQQILADFKGQWDELAKALEAFVREVRQGRQQDETGLDPRIQVPFLAILIDAVQGDGELDKNELDRLCGLTVELVDHIRDEVSLVTFEHSPVTQEHLRGWIFQFLDRHDLVGLDRLDALVDRIVELARHNRPRLVRA